MLTTATLEKKSENTPISSENCSEQFQEFSPFSYPYPNIPHVFFNSEKQVQSSTFLIKTSEKKLARITPLSFSKKIPLYNCSN